MALNFHYLFKINHNTHTSDEATFHNSDNMRNYVMQIMNDVVTHYDREYNFNPNEHTMKDFVSTLINHSEDDEGTKVVCQSMANRLKNKEEIANDQIQAMGKNIPNSILAIAYDTVSEAETRLFVVKFDFDEYLHSVTADDQTGFPKKKKIFKSCIFFVSLGGAPHVNSIKTLDNNTVGRAKYWWREFLDLQEKRDDGRNTLTALKAFQKMLKPIKDQHKQDYYTLRHGIMTYFRNDGDFDINHVANNIIGGYHQFDETLDMEDLKRKTIALPKVAHFDNVFMKVPENAKEKFKNVISLSPDIDLKLKDEPQNLSDIIKSGEDGPRRYIKIYSDEGYNFAKGLEQRPNHD